MSGPQRYVGPGPHAVVPCDTGDMVLFQDVEEALRDTERLKWMMPLINGSQAEVHDARRAALNRHRSLGFRGKALVDAAIKDCTE